MHKATTLLSSSLFPTQGDLRLVFLGMLTFLKNYQQQSSDSSQNGIVDAIHDKLEIYWNRHLSESSSISAILDPRYKLSTFTDLEERNNYIDHLQTLFTLYISNNSHIIPNRTGGNISQDSRNYFLNMINNNSQIYSSMNNSDFNEIDNYLSIPNETTTDPLLWWKDHQKEYPILSLIAKDYLIIQAISVPAEQAFSVAGNTITQTRNRLDPDTARATLCLKSWIENKLGLDISNINNSESNTTVNDSSDDSDYHDSGNSDFSSNSDFSNDGDFSNDSDFSVDVNFNSSSNSNDSEN
jgi:hypothetical protein